jgi:hypothetical protein
MPGGDVEEMWRVRGRQVPMGFGGEAWDVACSLATKPLRDRH